MQLRLVRVLETTTTTIALDEEHTLATSDRVRAPRLWNLRNNEERELTRFVGASVHGLHGSRATIWHESKHHVLVHATEELHKTLSPIAMPRAYLSCTGDRLASQMQKSCKIAVWNLADGKRIAECGGVRFDVWSFAFSANGAWVFAQSSYDQELFCWNASDGSKRWSQVVKEGGLLSASPDGTKLFLAGGTLREAKRNGKELWKHTTTIARAAAWSASGRSLFVAHADELCALSVNDGSTTVSAALPKRDYPTQIVANARFVAAMGADWVAVYEYEGE